MNEDDMQADRQWRVDKHIPLALILTILFQTAGATWWASGLSARVDFLEKQATLSAPMSDRITRLETKIEAINESLSEIKALLRQRPGG